MVNVITSSIAHSASLPVFNLVRPIVRIFALHWGHVVPMGVKFGTEEGTEGPLLGGRDPLLRAKFQPYQCNGNGVGPPKLKFLRRFDRNVEYTRPAGSYPLRDFHKIFRLCTAFQDALDVKILLDLLKGLWSYGGFNLRGSGCPQIFSAP